MSRFNHYFNNHFAACKLLAYARDIHRERDVRIYLVPGEWDAVGVTDGTDAWIAPVVQGHIYFHKVDVWQLLKDLREGKPLPKPEPLSARRRLSLDGGEPPSPTRAPRRRLEEESTPATTSRRRHVEA